jgi:hypothetical protein
LIPATGDGSRAPASQGSRVLTARGRGGAPAARGGSSVLARVPASSDGAPATRATGSMPNLRRQRTDLGGRRPELGIGARWFNHGREREGEERGRRESGGGKWLTCGPVARWVSARPHGVFGRYKRESNLGQKWIGRGRIVRLLA